MSAASIVGFVVAVAVDVVLPIVLSVWLIGRNHRRSRDALMNTTWWVITAFFLAFVGLMAWRAFEGVTMYSGTLVVFVTALAMPLGAFPASVHSGLMHLFFTDDEWAAYGYVPILTIYVFGMFAWALANVAGIRALASHVRQVRWA